ncbi:hypothetical protein [Paractinoplanes atraurantiacus]|uniref:Uncharacterized protein n=1 Tax=Paractinoplanes atraurantiacus TaxID=1036182 RepID=A0A285J7P1_9ACTN|nr:hypothetical protein [Actinoplanes atraurantiacus]SNY56350.1 hypothetical protein SAMN05421748_117137 [Actinoplanes atraurantiacus]
MKVQHIRLMADYGAFPLWGRYGGLSPEDLPLSAELVARLERWGDRYGAELGPEFEWKSEEARVAFIAEGRQLHALVSRELGDLYEITYVNDY